MSRRLNISIKADGTITAEVSGAPGVACLDSIDPLRSILNAEIAESKPTPEFSGVTNTRRQVVETNSLLEDKA